MAWSGEAVATQPPFSDHDEPGLSAALRTVFDMPATAPDHLHLDWAVGVLGGDLVAVTGLRDGGAPWLIETRRASDARALRGVLRLAPASQSTSSTAREHAGMAVAARGGVPVPNVLGETVLDDTALLLVEFLPGSSAQPATPDAGRLRALGAVAAAIFALSPKRGEATRLPRVGHPIPSIDFAALRAEARPQPLMARAESRVADLGTPNDPVGFVHGDLWSGNTLWHGGRLSAVLDWDCTGIGAAGIDLGSLRCDAAMCYGLDAADGVLAGWQDAAGHAAASVAYWDVVAALSTPPDIAWFAPAIAGMTHRPDLTASVLRERRDAFLADALDRLS